MRAKIHGINVELISSCPDFTRFVSNNYSHFLCENAFRKDIRVEFSYYSYPRRGPVFNYRAWNKLGTGIWLNNNELFIVETPGLNIHLKYNDDKLVIQTNFSEKWYHLLKKIRYGQSVKLQLYQYIMRQIIHFPVFWMLEKRQGIHLLHGAAVEKNGRALIFTGLNGVGKTTLAAYLCLNHNFKLFSDNFVLFDREKIYAFPENIRLSSQSVRLLRIHLQSQKQIYGKYHLPLESSQFVKEAKPVGICFISLTDEANTEINHISSEYTLELLTSIHHFLKEFSEYSYLALMQLVCPHQPVIQDKLDTLRNFLENVESYMFTMNKNKPLSKMSKEVLNAFDFA